MPKTRMTSLRSVLSFAVAVSMAACAFAAPAFAQNWQGEQQLRAGFFVQGGNTNFAATTAGVSDSHSAGNTGFGVTAGAEMLRAAGWSFGLEGDFGQSGALHTGLFSGTANAARFQGDYFASARGRAGYFLHRDFLAYATGGIGMRGVSVTDGIGDKADRTLYGAVYGGGLELHRGNTIFFAEYLHQNFNSEVLTVPVLGTYAISGHADAIRLGVKFKLGFDNYTDDVRDGLRR